LADLQEELDEARIIAEKARSTYDKLRKQRDFQKINHRRVQQEKSKLNNDASRNSSTKQKLQQEFEMYSHKYEIALKEKMLMKLEKDRLIAKVDNLEMSMRQNNEDIENDGKQSQIGAITQKSIKAKPTQILKMTNEPSAIPSKNRANPHLLEEYEPSGSHMSA